MPFFDVFYVVKRGIIICQKVLISRKQDGLFARIRKRRQKNMKDKIFGVLQRVGRSFMLPIAILPVAGLLLGIGSSFTNETTIATYGLQKILGSGTLLNSLLIIMNKVGSAVFDNLPLIFAVGVAIGMALSGTLQNFAGGVMILLFKPFKVGDTIEAQGQSGTVREIQIFNTILATPDNKIIIIPNGGLSTGLMKNYSKEATRRVDWEFGIAYGDDYTKAKSVIARLLDADGRVLKDPAYFIALTSLGESSVNIVVRAWVKSEDYWGVYFDMNEKVYKTFAEENLNIPFPQLDVHLHGKTE